MTIDSDLLNEFYEELYLSFGETMMCLFYKKYQGLTINVPKKMYDPKKVSYHLKQKYKNNSNLTKKEIVKIMRKYNYSERQVYRMLSEGDNYKT